MDQVNIIQVFDGDKPFKLDTSGLVRTKAIELTWAKLPDLELKNDNIILFILYCNARDVQFIIDMVHQLKLETRGRLIFVVESLQNSEKNSRLNLLGNSIVIDHSLTRDLFKIFIDQQIKLEYYRRMLKSLSSESRKRKVVIDRIMTLAQGEIQSAREESRALMELLNYEAEIRKSDKLIAAALEIASEWKEKELVDMKEHLTMMERLNLYRDKELARSQKEYDAANSALELGIRENLEREKIIEALDRLRKISDSELRRLDMENRELREKLGMESRSR